MALGEKEKIKTKKVFLQKCEPCDGPGPSAARPPPATQAPHTHGCEKVDKKTRQISLHVEMSGTDTVPKIKRV